MSVTRDARPSATHEALTTDLIVEAIFRGCDDFQQVANLAATSRYFNSIWRHRKPAIATPVARRGFPAFDDAILAVRATAIVTKHHDTDTLPPWPFPTKDITVAKRLPTISELREAYKFRHLIRCVSERSVSNRLFVEDQLRNFTREMKVPMKKLSLEDSQDPMLHRALYRIFYLGAALSHHYQKPLYQGRGRVGPNFLQSYIEIITNWNNWQNLNPNAQTADLDYLFSNPVFDIWNLRGGREAALQPLGKDIVYNCRALFDNKISEYDAAALDAHWLAAAHIMMRFAIEVGPTNLTSGSSLF